jgi:hypothetical protein
MLEQICRSPRSIIGAVPSQRVAIWTEAWLSWGTHLNREELVMSPSPLQQLSQTGQSDWVILCLPSPSRRDDRARERVRGEGSRTSAAGTVRSGRQRRGPREHRPGHHHPYLQKQRANGKTKHEAIRSLKHHAAGASLRSANRRRITQVRPE